jgi:hypothetical protein
MDFTSCRSAKKELIEVPKKKHARAGSEWTSAFSCWASPSGVAARGSQHSEEKKEKRKKALTSGPPASVTKKRREKLTSGSCMSVAKSALKSQ